MNKYSYLKIPLDYVCVYNKLAYCLLAYGVDIIKDCSASCKQINKDIVEYWNLFQLAITCYDKGEVGKAEYFINHIKNNLDKLYRSGVVQNYNGANNYFLNEDGKYTCIVCNGWIYELPNIKTDYEFILNTQDIFDEGKGQKIIIDITSTKIISDETSSSTEDIGYNPIIDVNWITYNNKTKELNIKANAVDYRETQIRFIQNESNKEVVLQIRQNKDTTEYEYYFEYEPKEFNFDKEGGEIQLVVTKSSKRELQDGLPVGDEIDVEWSASVDGYGFSYNPFTNNIVAEANDYKERTGKLIISRPELDNSKDIKIPITQQAGALTIIYSLQAVANQTILPALNGKTTLTVISTKQGYYGAEPIGEPEQVGFVISSARGFLTGVSQNGAVWTMSENITEVIREDVLIITQNAVEGKEVRINITQQPAVIDYVYDFRSEASTIRVEATGGQKTINVISTKQKTINGKNYGDPTIIDYTSSITGNFEINKNVINVPENNEEIEKNETATFIQNESNKQFAVTIVQNGAQEEYKYSVSVNEGTESINFNAKGGNQQRTITSTKQRYLNNEPQGEPIEVSFEVTVINNKGYNGFSLSNVTERGFTINATENREDKYRSGNIKIIQSESNKQIQIGLTQEAGVINYIYTFNVEEDSFNVPNYESSGITRYLTINSYKEKTVNGVKEGDPINTNYNISSNQSWCTVNNNSNRINIDENFSYSRTANITITQADINEHDVYNTKNITVKQSAVTIESIKSVDTPDFIFTKNNTIQTKYATVIKYDLINGHKKGIIENGTVTMVKLNNGDISVFNISNVNNKIQASYHGNFNTVHNAVYRIITDFGDSIGRLSADITSEPLVFSNLYNYIKFNFQFIYFLIPENYITIYQKLILLIVDKHNNIITKPTNIINKQLIDCWNLFQSAVAAYNLNHIKEADFFINFINNHINKYKDTANDLILELDDGELLKTINNNNENVTFEIDISTGQLIQIGETKDNITVKDNYLIQEYGTEN